MSQCQYRFANISPCKRSFEFVDIQYEIDSSHHHHILPSPKRRSSSHNSMQAEHNTIVMSDSFPSFMSVFGSEESELYSRAAAAAAAAAADEDKVNHDVFGSISAQQPQHAKPFQHSHRGSINSLFSDSTESSPTTTNSTFDSPLVSDNSASASPESASSLAPPTSFRPANKDSLLLREHDNNQLANDLLPQPTMQEPARNAKKLTLDMNLPSIRRPATSQGLTINTSHPLSAPTSPLKEPMKSARKKPTNLTIRTPAYNQLTFPRSSGIVPPTPNNRPSLHHNQSSPSLTCLASPTRGPAGGMFLPLPTLNTLQTNIGNRNSFLANSMPDLREETESAIPRSNEAPERGYTEGPVCIYDCGVYLYLEPTAEEARTFDTVINVAKEVRNPLKERQHGEGTVVSALREARSNRNSFITEPQTAVSEYSFRSAWEWPQPASTFTPNATTPTQSTFGSKGKDPEYLHVRWDHNSEILVDLYPLCKLIDERIQEGKKVLIHCQLGVSRSASLIIAYGLYKDYQPNFHAMYMAVKERSRWVGPNMSLIYQLTDFKAKLNKGDFSQVAAVPKAEWFVRSPDGPATPVATGSAPATVTSEVPPQALPVEESKAAPLMLNKALPPVPGAFPISPPPVQPTPEQRQEIPPPPLPLKTTTVKRAASRPLPFRERQMQMNIPEHRPRITTGIHIRQPSAVMDLAINDVPSTPSLFSPRATEFMATPFGIRGAGDLETPSNRLSKEIPSGFSWLPIRKEGHVRTASKDPRSPHQKEEPKGIYRSIADYL